MSARQWIKVWLMSFFGHSLSWFAAQSKLALDRPGSKSRVKKKCRGMGDVLTDFVGAEQAVLGEDLFGVGV